MNTNKWNTNIVPAAATEEKSLTATLETLKMRWGQTKNPALLTRIRDVSERLYAIHNPL